ncbi:MAG: tRNA-specific 2-thiouridylase [Polyangiales bacterium]|jgi:tRNA-specific 2-thiouridylase
MGERILVAMSGGVDSSVAAALLKEQGHDVFGVTLHLWDAAPGQAVGRCCAPEDRDDARKTCEHLGIPHYVLDEREAFRKHVIEPFLDSYRAGETPAPCARCNRTVKLVHLAELASRFGATAVATGHYARVSDGVLERGVDRSKDQSYFLFGVPPSVLKTMRFPLGGMKKEDVRAHGIRLEVPNANKPDSQELCFVPDGDIAGFVKRERGPGTEGVLRTEDGQELGTHTGVEGFTVGQRKGLGLGGGGARYVLRIVDNDVVVGDNASLAEAQCRVGEMHWMGEAPSETFRAEVRIRHRHTPAPAELTLQNNVLSVRFDTPQRAVTPGQAAVVYRGEQVLGGGFILS